MTEAKHDEQQCDLIDEARVNLTIFEELLGACRERLADNMCGLVHGGKAYLCFEGHDRFDEQGLWERHYAGPDFCNDLLWMFAAQNAILEAGRVGPYLGLLLPRLMPDWKELTTAPDVLRFYFAMAHAPPLPRAYAAAEALKVELTPGVLTLSPMPAWKFGPLGEDEVKAIELEQVVERAIALAIPVAAVSAAEDEERYWSCARPFIDFVAGLELEMAHRLLAVMYLGRGDHPDLQTTLEEQSTSNDLRVVGHQIIGKGRLAVEYLRKGLAKLRAAGSEPTGESDDRNRDGMSSHEA